MRKISQIDAEKIALERAHSQFLFEMLNKLGHADYGEKAKIGRKFDKLLMVEIEQASYMTNEVTVDYI